MSDKELVEYIKEHKKYPRTFYDYLNYFVFMFPLFFSVLGLTIIKYGKEPFEFFLGILLFLFGITVAILCQKKLTTSRQFYTINPRPNLTLDSIHEAIKSNFKLLRSAVDYNLNKIDATEPMTLLHYGSEFTLLFDTETVLINVRVGPYFQPFTFFRDKRNLKKIIKLLT